MDLAAPIIEKRGANNYRVSYGDDKGLFVEFYMRPVRQNFESEKANREIHLDKEYVKITCPGAPPRVVDREATAVDKERFERQYSAFKRQEQVVMHGTPLTELPFIGKAQALNMKAMGIMTAEQLSELPDQALEAIGLGARELREKAKAFLSKATDGEEISRLVSDNKNLLSQMQAMQAQLSQLTAPKIEAKPETLSLKPEKK